MLLHITEPPIVLRYTIYSHDLTLGHANEYTVYYMGIMSQQQAVASCSRRIKPGLTIVELLVVVVVIGILAAATIVSLFGISGRAKASAVLSDLTNAPTVLENYSRSTVHTLQRWTPATVRPSPPLTPTTASNPASATRWPTIKLPARRAIWPTPTAARSYPQAKDGQIPTAYCSNLASERPLWKAKNGCRNPVGEAGFRVFRASLVASRWPPR